MITIIQMSLFPPVPGPQGRRAAVLSAILAGVMTMVTPAPGADPADDTDMPVAKASKITFDD